LSNFLKLSNNLSNFLLYPCITRGFLYENTILSVKELI
jgi:hypothetical protein